MKTNKFQHRYLQRLETFARMKKRVVSCESLAEAGFVYKGIPGFEDRVQCYFCGLYLDGWLSNDIPWEEHKHWNEVEQLGCKFIDEYFGMEYKLSRDHVIDLWMEDYYLDGFASLKILSYEDFSRKLFKKYDETFCNFKDFDEITEYFKTEIDEYKKKNKSEFDIKLTNDLLEKYKCKICYQAQVEIIFQPCKHICCCYKCSELLTTNTCPLCSQVICKKQKFFI